MVRKDCRPPAGSARPSARTRVRSGPRAGPTVALQWPYSGPRAAGISGVNVGELVEPRRGSCRANQQVRGSVILARKGRSGTLTRKRSLVQIQYGPPGISCSWPYKVALCGPTTGPTARAKDMPSSQAHRHCRGRARAHIWPHRHAWERFMRPVALCGPTARADACPGLGSRWMRAVIAAGGRSRLPAPPRQEALLPPSGEVQARDLARRRAPAGARLARTVHDAAVARPKRCDRDTLGEAQDLWVGASRLVDVVLRPEGQERLRLLGPQGEAVLARDGQRCWYGRPGSTLDHSAGVMSRPATWQAKRSKAARPVGQIVAVPT